MAEVLAGSETAMARAVEMRVALCTPGELWGGIEQFVDTMSRYLQDSGVPVLVIVLHDGLLRARLDRAGIPVVLVPGRGPYDPRMIFAVARTLRQYRVNIVHTHGYRATVLGAIAAQLTGARLVRTEHGSLEPVTGAGRLKRSLNIFLERLASRHLADAVVFVSKDIGRHSRGASATVRQEVIYNGIQPIAPSTVRGVPEGLDDAPELFNMGIVGRLVPVKGHLTLLAAVGRLRNTQDLRLYVFGSGPLEDECRCFCQANGLGEIVKFLGFRQNIHDYLARLDLLVMPSRHEGLPYTLLEAMYLGVPVVATRVGGIAEAIEDGVTGILVPRDDTAALASAIERVRGDRPLRESLSRSGHDAVCERFLVAGMAGRYLDVYRDVLSTAVPAVAGVVA
ncbi:MAG: glycosyltransferase [Gammaproteobacteria bacterium]